MTRQMERNKKTTLLFLLAALQVCSVMTADCPNNPDTTLNCYTDYDKTITCVWNSTYKSEHTNARCTLHAKKIKKSMYPYSASCVLDAAHVSRPALRNCSLDFEQPYIFQSFHKLSINLSCDSAKDILLISYKPACHIKLNPPDQPSVNVTTVTLLSKLTHERIASFKTELQWKRWDQSWSDPAVQTKGKICKQVCEVQLDTDLLVLEERYEARVRVQPEASNWAESTWSDWSRTASWSSPVGIARQPSPLQSGLSGGILLMIIVGAALALTLAVMLFRNEKATWVYRKIRGPDPGKSFLKDPDFQNWLSPHFTNEFFLSTKLEDIASVEVVSTVDAVTLCSKEAPLLEKRSNESSSSFLNPSYSHLFPPTCSLPTTANLEPCAGDAPRGHSLGEGKHTEQDREEERMKELEILQLLSKGSNSEPVPVVSDYEKVEKLQVQCIRLHTLDSGVGSDEEVSEERMEADNISANESQDKGPKNLEEEKDGGNGQIDFQKLFGGSGSVFGKGSIQICSDYKPVQMLQPESPELPSLDSGVSSGGEERVSHEESLEDVDISSESTHFLFPPPLASSALQHSGLTSPQQLPKFSGLRSALRPPSPSLRAGGLEPSGDGYMPARQEPC
ncbi:uncharacterized protein [Paralichthys olivaceus]|uniref:uncharacterized protein isoform X1 n=1 Tax=Paralichthys olivaceus TaxID=8255 RepID=UPI0037500A36